MPESSSRERRIQILVPVYNEGEGARGLYEDILQSGVSFDSLEFVYDFDEDTTVPVVAGIAAEDPRVRPLKNTLGRGVVNALRFAFALCRPGPVVVVMGDRSDRLSAIDDMVARWSSGATVVCPCRYMEGGEQRGGGRLKPLLSRWAGRSLRLLGFPTADPTNNFKLYDGEWLARQEVQSRGGFEIALELVYKAFRDGRAIVDVPTVWEDRTQGESRFRVFAWLPRYLRWYLKALLLCLLRRVGVARVRASRA